MSILIVMTQYDQTKWQTHTLRTTKNWWRWNFIDSTGQGGNTTTGNIARRLLYSEVNRKLITDQILDESLRLVSIKFGEDLSVILRVMSTGSKIKVDEFTELCLSLYLQILTELPWVSVTPTLHKLLAHSWELIQLNNGNGLKCRCEEGIEANNERLQMMKTKLARKNNQLSNLHDIFRRLWLGSDPLVSEQRKYGRPFCIYCAEVGHSVRGC